MMSQMLVIPIKQRREETIFFLYSKISTEQKHGYIPALLVSQSADSAKRTGFVPAVKQLYFQSQSLWHAPSPFTSQKRIENVIIEFW